MLFAGHDPNTGLSSIGGGGEKDKYVRCHCKCAMIEWMVYAEFSFNNALCNRLYLDVNSTVIYCTGNFIPGRISICTSLKNQTNNTAYNLCCNIYLALLGSIFPLCENDVAHGLR
jgi:hypothetical protein